MKTNFIRGAEAVLKSFLEERVTTIFGYPGGAIMPVYDALYDYKEKLNHVLVRHEQGAIHAAQGFARTSGEVGVCIVTSGPGATNLITGLADAMIDSTPIVCVTGQVASHLLGTDAFQETDVMGISMPVTKWNVQVSKAEEIPNAIARAFYIARSGRPGPVLVDITKDAQFGLMQFNYESCKKIRSYNPNPEVDQQKIHQAVHLLNSAKKPMLLIGQGILLSKAEKELIEFVEKSGIPVASTLLGLGAFPPSHPNYVGFLGMHGNYAPNVKTNECDVLLAVGMRFDDRVTGDVNRYAKQAKIIHVDIDSSELNKVVNPQVGIHADAKQALRLLTKSILKKQHSNWLDEFRALEKLEKETLKYNDSELQVHELRMTEVVKLLCEKTQGNAIVVTDVGQHQMITSRYYKYEKSHSNITSGGLGTMGFALPAAIGAKFGNPSREVIAVIGDGGFQMTLQELGTIMQSKVKIKIIILNNNFLGMVRQWQELFFEKRYSGTEITNPNFPAIAAAYDIPAEKITDRMSVSKALDRLLSSPETCLLEVVVAKEENVFPMVPTGASVSEVRLN